MPCARADVARIGLAQTGPSETSRERALAEGADPNTTAVGDICSRELTTLKPTDSVGQAVRLMREKAVRRLPVVEDTGWVVGIVSIGDLAVDRDRRSALADISAAPPNV